MNMFIEAIGWLGTGLVLSAYALVSLQRMKPDSTYYRLFNLAGGVGIAINAFSHQAYPPALLNVIWAAIAVYTIVRGASPKRKVP